MSRNSFFYLKLTFISDLERSKRTGEISSISRNTLSSSVLSVVNV